MKTHSFTRVGPDGEPSIFSFAWDPTTSAAKCVVARGRARNWYEGHAKAEPTTDHEWNTGVAWRLVASSLEAS